MEFINQFLPTEILHALGWMVVHSLWQAFAIALLLAAYLLAWQKTNARKRYAAGNAALITSLLLAVGTFVFYLKNGIADVGQPVYSEEGGLLGRYFIENTEPSFFDSYFSENMPLIVTVWLVGLVIFFLKMLGGLLYIQRLKTRMASPLPKIWQERMAWLTEELGIARPVRLLESALVKAPMVVGWLKPVVLFPLGAVNNLAPSQVEAILAHELAHIARHDYLINLLQSLVEVIFYFNPAIWWISANVRTERENCCDDIAVRLSGNSLAYAKALVSLQEMQLAAPALALPFSKNKNQLLLRIQRILQPSQNKSNVMEKLSATLLLTVAVVLLSVQANTPFGNFITDVVTKQLPKPYAAAPAEEAAYLRETDTIPDGTRDAHIHYNTDEEDFEFRMEGNEITYLKVDGKLIPRARYGEYEGRIREILANVPEPPEHPEMPEFPEFPEMPAPPAPPGFHEFPAPPAPPAPPSRTRKITTQKDGNGTTFIIENEDGSEPVEIVVKDGKKGIIIVNGQEISGLKKGDKTIIIQENTPFEYDWNGAYYDNPMGGHYIPDMGLWERFPAIAAELEPLRRHDFSIDMGRQWELATHDKLNADERKAIMEEQREVLKAQITEIQERQQQLMGQHRKEMERAVEEARKAQQEVLRMMEIEQKEAKRRKGSM